MQLDAEGRGFSFQRDEPLDMRMDRTRRRRRPPICIADVDEAELADVIFQYGEERYSRRIARAIVDARAEAPIDDDRAAGARSCGGRFRVRGYQRIDPATRTFQALRIWVNRELDGLDAFLDAAARRLRAGRAAGGDRVPLARGSDRQAHVPRARAGRDGACGPDEAAGRRRRRRSGAQSPGAQRQAARD